LLINTILPELNLVGLLYIIGMNYLESPVQFSLLYPGYIYPQSNGPKTVGFVTYILPDEGTSTEITRLPSMLQISDKD